MGSVLISRHMGRDCDCSPLRDTGNSCRSHGIRNGSLDRCFEKTACCATRVQPTTYNDTNAPKLPDLYVSGIQTITETFPRDNYSKFDSEFSTENGLANSRFHTLLFGVNRLRSDEMPHCWAKSHCSGAIVQLLCNQNFQRFFVPMYANHER